MSFQYNIDTLPVGIPRQDDIGCGVISFVKIESKAHNLNKFQLVGDAADKILFVFSIGVISTWEGSSVLFLCYY